MNTWNDQVQTQMLLDALNFGNNALVWLPRKLINSCKAETITAVPVPNGIATTTDLLNVDITNFFPEIPFAADSTHMGGLTWTGKDVTWTQNGIVQLQPFHAANGNLTTVYNILAPRRIVFSSVCDWNLIMTADNHL